MGTKFCFEYIHRQKLRKIKNLRNFFIIIIGIDFIIYIYIFFMENLLGYRGRDDRRYQ